MSSISEIPSDILGEILVRLPAESLCRSRAVSKGFRSLIDDPYFVRAHTIKNHQHQLSSSTILLQNNTFRSFVGACYSLDLEALTSCRSSNTGQQAIAAKPVDFEFITSSELGLSSPVAACDGLVLTQNETDFTIWNPLTHERLDLPPEPDFSRHDSSSAFGLGYDAATDDFKAVAVIQSVRHTHVYSLKQNTWRRIIDCPLRDGHSFSRGAGVFMRGALNWLSTRDQGRRYDDDKNIIALDLRTEKYSLLQMPPRKMRWNRSESTSLNVVGGCLAFFDSGYCTHLDVWVMKDYGHGDSWIKLFSIVIANNYVLAWSGFLKPICFIREEKLVLLQDSCKRFFLFDVETKSFKSVNIICGSIIGNDSYLYAKRLFVGTIFRLHANCGVTTKKKASASLKWVKRNCSGLYWYAKQKFAGTICCCFANCGDVLPTTTTKKKKKASSSKDIELIFYTRGCNQKVYKASIYKASISSSTEVEDNLLSYNRTCDLIKKPSELVRKVQDRVV